MSVNANPLPRRPYSYGPLYDLLVETFPKHRSQQNVFDIPGFAIDIGYTHETLYKAVRQRRLMTPNVALQIIKFSRANPDAKALSWGDMLNFVLPEYTEHAEPADVDGILG